MRVNLMVISLAPTILLATIALAADQERVEREVQWIERTEKEAYGACRDSTMSEAQQIDLLCEKYSICSRQLPCNTVVHRWRIDEIKKLKKDPDQYFYDLERKRDMRGSR